MSAVGAKGVFKAKPERVLRPKCIACWLEITAQQPKYKKQRDRLGTSDPNQALADSKKATEKYNATKLNE
jgi:hypothetical protein